MSAFFERLRNPQVVNAIATFLGLFGVTVTDGLMEQITAALVAAGLIYSVLQPLLARRDNDAKS